jgi:CMP-N,N'-diacetyllegionaminic acid synthase
MSDIIAIIPARSGSKSISDKNITCLSKHPLIAFSIAAAQLSTEIDRVIVSTDSEQYAKIAIKYGAEVPFIRPREFATDNSTDRDFLVHAMEWFDEHELQTPEYWVHHRPTTPLRDPVLIDSAIKAIQQRKGATSLQSGYKAPESPFKWFRKDSSGFFRGLLAEDNNSEFYNLPKEAFEDVYIPDGYAKVAFCTAPEGTYIELVELL